jgi:hypothetical protein
MPLLAYCIAEVRLGIETPKYGVQENVIRTVPESGLVGFVSDYNLSRDRGQVRSIALEFNRVLQDLLRQVAIVPFRFPTVVADESEMSRFLLEHAEEYRETLLRLRDSVQMEISLTIDRPAPTERASGTQYLRSRQAWRRKLTDAADAMRHAVSAWIQDWHQHESSTGLRCYILISRSAVPAVLEKLQRVGIPADLHARVTGPWPATEFLRSVQDRKKEKRSDAKPPQKGK